MPRLGCRELYVRGCRLLDDGAIDFVTVTLDGRTYRCPTGLESDDVAGC
jgi:hypothetical protein